MKHSISLLLLAGMICAANLSAGTSGPDVQLQFSGVFDTKGAPGPFSQPFAHAEIGDRYYFAISYEPGSPDLLPADTKTGYYKAINLHLLEIESGSSAAIGSLDGFDLYIRVDNDIDIAGTTYDRFIIRGYRNPGPPFTGSGSLFISQQLAFEPDAFDNDQLPLTLPPLSEVQAMGFQSGFLIFEVDGLNGYGFGLALLRADIDDFILDTDGDGISNDFDICPFDPDNDIDDDEVCGDVDNCSTVPNLDQADDDSDGVGNVCDTCPYNAGESDQDKDCISDATDNCPNAYNFDQLDTDGDNIGDVCDQCVYDPQNDGDWDGLCAEADNCPLVTNPDQFDTDGDDLGDACDTDDDGDGLTDDYEQALGTDFQDPDTDNDGVGDALDLCQGLIIDQAHYLDFPSSLAALVNSRVSHAQSFMVGSDGIIELIKLPIGRNEYFDLDTEVDDLTISLTGMTGGLPDDQSVLGTAIIPDTLVPVSQGLFASQVPVDIGPLGIQVQQGELLAITVRSAGSQDSPVGPYFWSGASGAYEGQDGYVPGQRAYINTDQGNQWQSALQDDMGFQVYIGDGFKPGDIVNQEGCSIEQVCPCQNDWKTKGKYVSCVANISGDFRKDGLISKSESAKITSEAAKSSCGGK